MRLCFALQQMTRDAERVRALAEGVSAEQARWRPAPEAWSLLEVVCHLRDEEREDFRVLLDLALHRPEATRPPIAPGRWVTERNYNADELGEALQAYLAAREDALAWLRSLEAPDWSATYRLAMPFGALSAGDILASWVAHDLLHLRQLVELHYAYAVQQMEPYRVDYAGPW